MACEAAEVGGDFGEAGESEQGDGGVAERGQVLRAVPASDLALVFAVSGVANPVESILDTPMAAPTGEQLGGVGAFA